MRLYYDRRGRYRGLSIGWLGVVFYAVLLLCLLGAVIVYWQIALVAAVLWLVWLGWRAQHRA